MTEQPRGLPRGEPDPPSENADEGWRHLSPWTPVVRLGVVALAILGYFIAQSFERLFRVFGGSFWSSPDRSEGGSEGSDNVGAQIMSNAWIALAVLVGLLAIVGLVAWLNWRFSRYRITHRQVEFKKGWLFREHRQVPLDRIQAVELRRPLLAQLLRLAEVDVQSAGGNDSHLKIAFLPLAQAHEVRLQIQHLAAGRSTAAAVTHPAADHGEPAPRPAPRPAPDGTSVIPDVPTGGQPTTRPVLPGELLGFAADEGRPVLSVPNGRLFVATMLHGSVFALIGVALMGVLSSVVSGGRWSALEGFAASLPAAGPIMLGIGFSRVKELLKHGNFRLSDVGSTVRIIHSGTDHRTTSIPLQRVQAMEMVQPLWWRPLGWWRAQLNVAGAAKDDMDMEQGTVVLPVGSFDQAMDVLTLIDPGLEPEAVRVAALGMGGEAGWVTASRSARFLDPLSWRRRGYAVSGHGILVRSGRYTRRVISIPHARIQSQTIEQGPLDRRLGLADVHLISTPGPVKPRVEHLELAQAERFLAEESLRAGIARRSTPTACADQSVSGGLVTQTSQAPKDGGTQGP